MRSDCDSHTHPSLGSNARAPSRVAARSGSLVGFGPTAKGRLAAPGVNECCPRLKRTRPLEAEEVSYGLGGDACGRARRGFFLPDQRLFPGDVMLIN